MALLLCCAVLPATAGAARSQESIFQDDRLLLFSGGSTRESALTEIDSLGADMIHSIAFWGRIAPSPDSKKRPAGFDAANPAAYSPGSWDPYDGLVRAAAARGMSLLLTPAGPTPAWASDCKGSVAARRTCNPDTKEYGAFVTAIARRYSGAYADENQGGGVLPRIGRWSIWNEPNLGGWLQPQLRKKSGRVIPSSPHRYRRLVYAATAALRATGHGGDKVLLGETAPIGRRTGPLAKRSMPPADFYRELFCLDRRGRAFKGRNAKLRGCRKMKKLKVSGVAHHPYTAGAGRPPSSKGSSGDVTISSISRLKKALALGSKKRRIRSSPPIYLTEFGFQTDPPDSFVGVSPGRQASYINRSDYIAFRNSRVRSVAQYELIDEPEVSTFNTGLRFTDGRAKPSLAAYRLPIYVVKSGKSAVKVFGQARSDALAAGGVEIQQRTSNGFQTVATPALNGSGYFLVKVKRRGGVWRLRAGGFTSREARPAKR